MRKICAWCKKELEAGDPSLPMQATSHGICYDCAKLFRGNVQVPLKNLARLHEAARQLAAMAPIDPRD